MTLKEPGNINSHVKRQPIGAKKMTQMLDSLTKALKKLV